LEEIRFTGNMGKTSGDGDDDGDDHAK